MTIFLDGFWQLREVRHTPKIDYALNKEDKFIISTMFDL